MQQLWRRRWRKRFGCRLALGVFLLQLLAELQAVAADKTRCKYNLEELWSTSLRGSALTATPLLFDVDGDGWRDVVAPSYSGEVWAVHGENGHVVDGWPFYLDQRGFHASPLVYDVNKDGLLDFILITSDAEVVFLQADNTLLHGETIKIPPLRMMRDWFSSEVDKESLKTLMSVGMNIHSPMKQPYSHKHTSTPPPGHEREGGAHHHFYSEFKDIHGLHSDPLYSRHQSDPLNPRPPSSGVDPNDPSFVYVDPHVLATPTLADLDGDGMASDLVVPVSYYFDPFQYGEPHSLASLGLEEEELTGYVAGGLALIDIDRRQVVQIKTLGISQVSSSVPAYTLSTPTIVQLSPSSPSSSHQKQGERRGRGRGRGEVEVVVGMASGELHVLQVVDSNRTLVLGESAPGFPVTLDAIVAQVGVADVRGTGTLDLAVGDYSGNVYLFSAAGERLWEFSGVEDVIASVRFADIGGNDGRRHDDIDGTLDVIFVTNHGSVWALDGQTGKPLPNYPVSLNVLVQSSVLLVHLDHSGRGNALTILVPAMNQLYLVDAFTGCVDSVSSPRLFLEALADDIDPYSPGMELLVASLDGHLVCFSTGSNDSSPRKLALESWPGEALGQNSFTHKSNSFAVVFERELAAASVLEASGSSFQLEFKLLDYTASAKRQRQPAKQYSVVVTMGQRGIVHNDTFLVHQRESAVSLTVATPPVPLSAIMAVRVCNPHAQCDTAYMRARFHSQFLDTLALYLAYPFLCTCLLLLWLLKDVGTTATSSQPSLPRPNTYTPHRSHSRKDV